MHAPHHGDALFVVVSSPKTASRAVISSPLELVPMKGNDSRGWMLEEQLFQTAAVQDETDSGGGFKPLLVLKKTVNQSTITTVV